MNFIKSLQETNLRQKLALEEFNKTIQEFRKHLSSDKFRVDTTIQVQDVREWLNHIVNNSLDVLEGVE